MSYTKDGTQKVRDKPIAEMLGVQMDRQKKMICCPMPDHNDGTPSFLLDDANGFHCFGCDAKGFGMIDFLEQLYWLCLLSNRDRLYSSNFHSFASRAR